MTLIKSISGIRGTIGGKAGQNLTPQDIVESAAAFGQWCLHRSDHQTIVVGRDGRISGELVSSLAIQTLRMLGFKVLDLGLSTTPTVEMIVQEEEAAGGIIFTASHNPMEWNALKFLNADGEFISAADGQELLDILAKGEIEYASVQKLGAYERQDNAIERHIKAILNLPLVKAEKIRDLNYKIIVDGVNSTGAIAVPALLEALGCTCILLNGEVNGRFAHNPEPLEDHLSGLIKAVSKENAHLGIAVDPDVDRLAFIQEDGTYFGEEYTLVAVADYILRHNKGNTVSNLSSTRALRDVTLKHGGEYAASAVGEVNVVKLMKETNAVIGGEGNGGIIYPELHYGRDALVGIALFLSYLADSGSQPSMLRSTYPAYFMSKNKIALEGDFDPDALFDKLADRYKNANLNRVDGLKIDLEEGWIHLRKSNTEPVVRIYTESTSEVIAENLANKIKGDIIEMLKE
ncbi:MAG: phosphoglucosamine mutase [Bacteroidetes bacterium]|nr:phosphoglucosamine mutase [Bacteroidota bacterium]